MPGSLRLCICPLLFCLKKKEGEEDGREAHSKVLRGSFTFSAEGGRSIAKLSVYAALSRSLSLISVKEQVNCTDVPARPLPPSPPLLPCPYFVGGSFSRPQSCRNCPSTLVGISLPRYWMASSLAAP